MMHDDPALLAPLTRPRRRANPLGVVSIVAGIVTCALSIWLFIDVLQQPHRSGDAKITVADAAVGAIVYLGLAAVAFCSGCIGGVAGLAGLIRRPRWQGFVGLLLNVALPLALIFVAQYVRNR